MPNYEIYPGDIASALETVDNQPLVAAVVDSTSFYVQRTGSRFDILRNHASVGHIHATVSNGVLRLGQLEVSAPYRSRGVSTLLLWFGLYHGVRSGALQVTLNEDSEVGAYGFWARAGIQVTAGVTRTIRHALARFEESQAALADRLGLARSPGTMLLNTDLPAQAQQPAVVHRRRNSFGK